MDRRRRFLTNKDGPRIVMSSALSRPLTVSASALDKAVNCTNGI
jgi:hypothetical protein